jgi:hypothetical protein
MARSRGNAAHDLRQPKVDNASNLSLQGRCQLDQLDAQRRSFLGREVVRWRGIYAAIDNATRQVLGFSVAKSPSGDFIKDCTAFVT